MFVSMFFVLPYNVRLVWEIFGYYLSSSFLLSYLWWYTN